MHFPTHHGKGLRLRLGRTLSFHSENIAQRVIHQLQMHTPVRGLGSRWQAGPHVQGSSRRISSATTTLSPR